MNKFQDVHIRKHMDIFNARKDVCFGSDEPYKGQLEEVSEWAMAITFNRYKIGTIVPFNEFYSALLEAITQQSLSKLIDSGDMEMMWNEEEGQFSYRITEQGRKRSQEG